MALTYANLQWIYPLPTCKQYNGRYLHTLKVNEIITITSTEQTYVLSFNLYKGDKWNWCFCTYPTILLTANLEVRPTVSNTLIIIFTLYNVKLYITHPNAQKMLTSPINMGKKKFNNNRYTNLPEGLQHFVKSTKNNIYSIISNRGSQIFS